jgi:hypothetical protein
MDFDRGLQLTQDLRANLGKVVKGHDTGVDLLVIALMAKGHILLESVPGDNLPLNLPICLVLKLPLRARTVLSFSKDQYLITSSCLMN